jgi:hypothetical protein
MATAIFLIAPTAFASTITFCSDGDGTVCEISNVTIDGNSYNVTFGFTPDFSLNSIDPSIAIDAIVSALSDNSCSICYVGVNNFTYDSVPITDTYDFIIINSTVVFDSAGYADAVMSLPDVSWYDQGFCHPCSVPAGANYSTGVPYVYAEFSSASTTPEPGSIVTMLGGLAILALLERKRRTHQNQSIAQAR